MDKPKIFMMPFSKIYPMYLEKAQRKEKTKEEVNQIIFWLTGYDEVTLQSELANETSIEDFFKKAPAFNPNANLIKGMICGYRVEDIEDETMQRIRYLDKLIDELTKGKKMEKILRK